MQCPRKDNCFTWWPVWGTMADVKKWKRTRAGHRADVTKRQRMAKEILDNFELSKQSALEALHTVLLEKYSTPKELDQHILDRLLDDENTLDEDLERDVSEASDFELEIQTTLQDIKKELKWVAVDKRDDRSLSGESTRSSERNRRVKLPKIEVDKFSGDPKKWQEWWDSFDSLINSNELSDVDKFYYLRSYYAIFYY